MAQDDIDPETLSVEMTLDLVFVLLNYGHRPMLNGMCRTLPTILHFLILHTTAF